MIKDGPEIYQWPEGLYPLRDWLKVQGVDVLNLKNERQALYLGQRLAGRKIKIPNDRHASLILLLLKLQRNLNLRSKKSDGRRDRDQRLGKFGPASAVRRIDPAQYLAEKAAQTAIGGTD